MIVRAPVLLDDSFAEARRLDPSSLAVQHELTPPSVADMTVPLGGGAIPVRGWVRLYTVHGDMGIFRASTADYLYDTDEQRIALVHGICTLSDSIVPQPTGEDAETQKSGTLSSMLIWLLQQQHAQHWRLGTVAANSDTVTVDLNGSDLLTMLLAIMDQVPDYELRYDMDEHPWTLNVARKQETVTAEGRLTRNLGSVHVSYNDADLCTRVYASALSGGYMSADTAGTYGVVSQSLYLDPNTTAADAQRIAARYLEKRKEPAIAVELDAVDLAEATGEPLDALTLGKKFRLALPAYGVTVEQWITGITYSDVYGDPNHLTLTLANRIADLAQQAAKAETAAKTAATAKQAATSAQQQIIVHSTKLQKTDKYLKFLDDEGLTVMRSTDSSVQVGDALASMKAMVTDTYGHTVNPDNIKQVISSAHITVDATQSLVEIIASVSRELKGDTESNAASITAKVDRETLLSEIAAKADNITISGRNIVLNGYVTADQLSAAITSATTLAAATVNANQHLFVWGDEAEWQQLDVVTEVQKHQGTYGSGDAQIGLFDSNGVLQGRASYTNIVNNIRYYTRSIHFLGMDTDSAVSHTAAVYS